MKKLIAVVLVAGLAFGFIFGVGSADKKVKVDGSSTLYGYTPPGQGGIGGN